MTLLSGVTFIFVMAGSTYLTSKPDQANSDEARMINEDAQIMLKVYSCVLDHTWNMVYRGMKIWQRI